MSYRTLITTADLARLLSSGVHDPAHVVIDCRFKLDDVGWGEREYTNGHIPGARYAHLDRDLSGPKTGTNGRHPLPDPTVLAAILGRLGVARGAQVIAYDQGNGMFASRLWWLLRWMGHDEVAVLDGGLAKWMSEGRPAAAGGEPPSTRVFHGAPNSAMTIAVATVADMARGTGTATLVDARAAERYRGEVEPLDRVAGHIPGAKNFFFQQNLNDAGTFRSPDDLRARWQAAIGESPVDAVVCYCGSGVTACHNLLALEHAGLHGAKLYPGSWSEWCADETRPIETGG